jgi:hypothetical protein
MMSLLPIMRLCFSSERRGASRIAVERTNRPMGTVFSLEERAKEEEKE